ncbi:MULTISPECIES: very short patch repair endonuclease [Bacteroides]|jgi:DNA mismatch endonuclease (patch repair protein)|nr:MULTISPECIES: very short patch repair endonuclease [Bacteroides]MDV7051375.1 very short patch repair endonuclease [Bacteroides ovatus]
MDNLDKNKRSCLMAKIKQKNTEPEIIVRHFLYSKGFRYRINLKSLPGSPDIVLPKYKTVIFVHGCFWHGHTCKAGHLPTSNLDYWKLKIEKNIERDRKKNEELEMQGWNVIVVWQCEVKTLKNRHQRLFTLVLEIMNNKMKTL